MTELSFNLYNKQWDFVTSPIRNKAFVGGIGTGKTHVGAVATLKKLLELPGETGLITAPTYGMLRDATMDTFYKRVPRELVAYRTESQGELGCGLHVPGGGVSHVIFRSTHNPEHLRGPNLAWAWMDEAALSTKYAARIVRGRLRAGPPEKQQMLVTTTPKGMNWIYDLFGPHVDNPRYYHVYAATKDNPFLPEDFLHDVYGEYDGAFAQQELEGKFVGHEGLVYRIDYSKHIGDYPFIPSLPVVLAWDFGYPNPEAVLAIQQTAEGDIFVIDEVYRRRTMTEDVVADVKSRIWYPNVVDCIADEARPDQIIRLQTLGIPARPSNKGRILDGIAKVQTLLKLDPARNNTPTLHVNKRCEDLIKEFDQYHWAERKTPDDDWKEKPVDAFNHALDALRYWAIMCYFPRGERRTFGTSKRPTKRVMGYQLLGTRGKHQRLTQESRQAAKDEFWAASRKADQGYR